MPDRIALTPKHLGLVCLLVLIVILSLGLWPFHIPENDVAWLNDRPGLQFGGTGTAIASTIIPTPGPGAESGGSVEVWLQPGRISDSGTFLAFYDPGHSSQLLLRQSLTDLEISIRRTAPSRVSTRLYAGDVFRSNKPLFLTIASGAQGLKIYVDGVLLRTVRHVLPTEDFAGRMIVGDAPGQTDSWKGRFFGLAIYHRELPLAQVARHNETWTRTGLIDIAHDAGSVALYPMDERAGRIIHDKSGNGLNLFIPEKYMIVDQISLEPFWQEFSMSRSYWSSVLKNIVGFIPLGCCFCAWLVACRFKRPALVTVVLGAAVSLTIEILQAYLPTRDSGTTDIITNTIGTWIGVALYNLVVSILARAFPALLSGTPLCRRECVTEAHGDRD